jgi:acyl dehydratase
MEILSKTFDQIQVGDIAFIERQITKEDIQKFADVSEDFNPVHVDEKFANESMFHGIIAHGIFSGALVSAVLGTKLPGIGTIYLNQSLSFRKPIRPGDTIRTEVVVVSKNPEKKRLILDCKCTNQKQEIVTLGQAEVIAP